ncbi:SWI/SNF complex subunit SWI3A [Cornus florida]|uniref:SWI/SNF complex subunit SWI3A n=1 Tax=Cornus florida TaxID=4283 RepID=UPI0028A095E1|nr:SWI/SNF complex subunit SWI3A [Cornus florida]
MAIESFNFVGTSPGMDSNLPADESQLDLYTIPSRSSWFSWDDIHETEKSSLREFFDVSSITRTPKIYKEYRDFIISKFREEPSRRLTFTEVRKSLVGDVFLLRKVFCFLENWGLINFGAPSSDDSVVEGEEREERCKVRVEEGAPNGVRVVEVPNSLRPVLVPPVTVSNGDEVVESGFKLPSLASYTDVYSEKELLCGNCKERCDSGHYKHTKEGSFIICVKCFKNGNYGENKSVDDFKFIDFIPDKGNNEAAWTEAETLLLLESVLKHGDDWELVAQTVKTKAKLDCISKLIQLPFGDLMVGSAHRRGGFWDADGNMSSDKQVQLVSSESQEVIRTEDQYDKPKDESQQNGDAENNGPPLKRKRIAPPSDASSSLMKQVALISTMVGPYITASAAEAAVTVLCNENQCTREIFDGDDNVADELGPTQNIENERVLQIEDSEMEGRNIQPETHDTSFEEDPMPITLRMRAATATALGAAAAHAKLLADQEDREIEYLVANIIEMQLKKLHRKIKHFEHLELIMEKEYAQVVELEESVTAERINVLQKVFNAGISIWRDNTLVKSQTGGTLMEF